VHAWPPPNNQANSLNTEQASLPTVPTSAQPSTHSSATERWAPGMMDTVLNVGLNDHSVLGLTDAAGDERFAWDSYRRLIQMFGKTVLGVDGDAFAAALDAAKQRQGVGTDVELTA